MNCNLNNYRNLYPDQHTCMSELLVTAFCNVYYFIRPSQPGPFTTDDKKWVFFLNQIDKNSLTFTKIGNRVLEPQSQTKYLGRDQPPTDKKTTSAQHTIKNGDYLQCASFLGHDSICTSVLAVV